RPHHFLFAGLSPSPSRLPRRSTPPVPSAMASPPRVLLGHALLLTPLLPLLACAGLVLEDGYTVSTVSDLNPTGTHPYALLPRPRAGDLVLLDSAGSTLYTLPLPVSADAGPR
uniref:Uncharacterized protein n=1 Tax=Aegilops tauschii subsp. strangulata TaxID=200361 RepID=A0A453AUD2_AEGTS